jgi:hypothetical protein
MRIGQPLEPVMYSYKSIFDAWEAGGVCGLVLGRMHFEGNIPDAVGEIAIQQSECCLLIAVSFYQNYELRITNYELLFSPNFIF